MCKKVKIVNKSSRELPEEAVDAISFKTLTDANEVLEEYNLKILEMEREFEDGSLITQIFTIADYNR
jgi:hypothetical protein